MKQVLKLFLPILILASCSDAREEKPLPAPVDSTETEEMASLQFDLAFPRLNDYLLSEDSLFDPLGFDEGEPRIMNDSSVLNIDTADYRPYLPYLLFNADSSYALDLVSYNYLPAKRKGKIVMLGQGPDFEAAILDMKNGRRKRLLFFGPSGDAVLDAKWLDTATVAIAGATELHGRDSLRPVMWTYNVDTKAWQQFVYPRMVPANPGDYPVKLYELNP